MLWPVVSHFFKKNECKVSFEGTRFHSFLSQLQLGITIFTGSANFTLNHQEEQLFLNI